MEKIKQKVIDVLNGVIDKIFPQLKNSERPSIYIDVPKNKQFGDLSTNIAMQIAKKLNENPRNVASQIHKSFNEQIDSTDLREVISDAKVEGPGFINFNMKSNVLHDTLREILKKGGEFGRCDVGNNEKLQIEFVSANPTGPLSIAHARQAALGDALAAILSFLGWKVSKEYYVNDEGNQIRLLGESIRARCFELLKKDFDFPETGYKGKYIYDIAHELIEKYGDELLSKDIKIFEEYGVTSILKGIKEDLKDFKVEFDNWFSQKKLSTTDKIRESFDELKKKDLIYKKDEAVWFKSTQFSDDKDRVLVKSDGTLTYIAPDIAYHRDKLSRGYKRLINIWGPDHHGYISRLKAAVTALGSPGPDCLSILIVQLVTLYKNKAPIPMSTREGQFITMRELVSEVGRDAARYFFLMRKIDSHLDFDMELAKSQTPENPVFYVQYAHARISSIFDKVDVKKTALIDSSLDLLTQPEEMELIKQCARFPEIVKQAGMDLEPYRLIPYLEVLSKTLHGFYDKHRVITEDKELSKARFALVEAVRIVIENGLTLIGVSAPSKM